MAFIIYPDAPSIVPLRILASNPQSFLIFVPLPLRPPGPPRAGPGDAEAVQGVHLAHVPAGRLLVLRHQAEVHAGEEAEAAAATWDPGWTPGGVPSGRSSRGGSIRRGSSSRSAAGAAAAAGAAGAIGGGWRRASWCARSAGSAAPAPAAAAAPAPHAAAGLRVYAPPPPPGEPASTATAAAAALPPPPSAAAPAAAAAVPAAAHVLPGAGAGHAAEGAAGEGRWAGAVRAEEGRRAGARGAEERSGEPRGEATAAG